MMRTQVVKLARAYPRQATRSFSAAAIRAGEGDTGSVRSGGGASADAFSKREQANENMFIRQRETEALKRLKDRLDAQQKHLDELNKHLEDLTKDQGGEQH